MRNIVTFYIRNIWDIWLLFIPSIWLSTAFIAIGYFQCFKVFSMFKKCVLRNASLLFLISIYLFIFVLAIKCYQRIHLLVVYVTIWTILITDVHPNTYSVGYINLSILYIIPIYPQCVKRYDQSSLLLLLLLLFIADDDGDGGVDVDACVQYANFQRMNACKKIARVKCVRIYTDASSYYN